ncbi:radical SAM protein [bacterium]|nr:MAG: radical SAM protein [bacterium]
MRVIFEKGSEDIAKVYVLELDRGVVECVESLDPLLPREKKWVCIVSTLYGCPIKCRMCDAGGEYKGKLTKEEILAQIDFLVKKRFGKDGVKTEKWKLQFARMGEPSLNPAVLEVLKVLPSIYPVPSLIPSISTVAPEGTDEFFENLVEIKNALYPDGRFQLQFSIHTTDERKRDEIIPVRKWNFEKIGEYGKRFYKPGDRKITLNFAPSQELPLEPSRLRKYFDPEVFLVKITPLNPTEKVKKKGLVSMINPFDEEKTRFIVSMFEKEGYTTILSIGELRENLIGSNCGQYVTLLREGKPVIRNYPHYF